MKMQRSLIHTAIAAVLAAPLMADAAPAAKPKFCDKSWDETGVVKFAFGDGTTLEFDTKRCDDQTKLDLLCHGASQKIGDSFAGAKGNFAEGKTNAQAVIDQLYEGKWNADREGGVPRLAELAEAIARIKGVAVEAAMKAVEAGTDEQRKAWRSNAKVKAVIAQVRAEAAAKALEAAGEQALDITV